MTNEQVKADIAANLPDNTTRVITPAKLRTELGTMVDYSDSAAAQAAAAAVAGLGVTAASFGFSPSATGEVNSAALQAAVNASPTLGPVMVALPGVYLMSTGIEMPANSSLSFGPNIILQKSKPMTCFFYCPASNATNRVITSHVTLRGCGTRFENGGFIEAAPIYNGAMGLIDLCWAYDWRISGFIAASKTGTSTWLVHACEATKIRIEDMIAKDDLTNAAVRHNMQFNAGCKDITIRNYESCNRDDSIALLAADYPPNVVTVNPVENVTIENWTDNPLGTSSGFSIRIIPACWNVWSATEYRFGEFATNDGNVYQAVASSGGWPFTASTAPTHTSGDATGADGITWRWMKAGSEVGASVRNVTLKNCRFNGSRPESIAIINDDNTSMRSTSVGASDNAAVENVVIDNCSWTPPDATDRIFIVSSVKTKGLTIRDCSFAIAGTNYLYYADHRATSTGYGDAINFDRCRFDQSGTRFIQTYPGAEHQWLRFRDCIFAVSPTNDRASSVNAMGNIANVLYSGCTVVGCDSLLYPAANSSGNLFVENCVISGHRTMLNLNQANISLNVFLRGTVLGQSTETSYDNSQIITASAGSAVRVWLNGGVILGGTLSEDSNTEVVYSDVGIDFSYIKGVAGDLVKYNATGAWMHYNGSSWGAIRN